MVESNLDAIRREGHIVICPNMSGRWPNTKILLCFISCSTILIAVFFALLGLWLIVPFAGLETIALISVVYWVAHQCQRKQVIHLSSAWVRVEKGHCRPTFTWESELFWTCLMVDKSPYRGHPCRLFLCSKKQKLEIGEFLNEQDKKKLVTELRGMINVVN